MGTETNEFPSGLDSYGPRPSLFSSRAQIKSCFLNVVSSPLISDVFGHHYHFRCGGEHGKSVPREKSVPFERECQVARQRCVVTPHTYTQTYDHCSLGGRDSEQEKVLRGKKFLGHPSAVLGLLCDAMLRSALVLCDHSALRSLGHRRSGNRRAQ